MNGSTLIGIALWALIPGFIAKRKGRSFWGYYLLSFIITPVITMIITLCLSNKKAQNASVSPATDFEVSTPNTTGISPITLDSAENVTPQPQLSTNSVPRKILYCRRCGSLLIDGSEFCSNCGNEIEKEGAQ